MTEREAAFAGKKRVVVKIGSSSLTYATGKLNYHRMEQLVREIADLANSGREMILVSSAAVSAGMASLGLSERPKEIRRKQALAAVGQGLLMHTYEELFREYGQIAGQVLLTRMDAQDRSKFMHSRNTLLTMIDMHIIPIINENDVVAVDEFKIGDNDTLAAMVSSIIDADLLILLSDVDGLDTSNPQHDKGAQIIRVVEEIDKHFYDIAGGAGSVFGTGGMYTKIKAAAMATSAEADMVIASGSEDGVIRRICAGEPVGTWFKAKESHLHSRKRWLLSGGKAQGTLIVDEGCRNAIVYKGASLLPVGICRIEGDFCEGDIVAVVCEGITIAKGIVNYDSSSIAAIKGKKTEEISAILGYDGLYDEVIHRDNLVAI